MEDGGERISSIALVLGKTRYGKFVISQKRVRYFS